MAGSNIPVSPILLSCFMFLFLFVCETFFTYTHFLRSVLNCGEMLFFFFFLIMCSISENAIA